MSDLNKALNDAATRPQSISVDGQSMTNRPLTEQIAAVKFRMATRARTLGPAAGVSFTKLKPHGAVLSDGCGNRDPVTGL